MKTSWWLALILHLTGLGLFLSYLVQTDFMFGHFHGPLSLLLASAAVTTAALVTGVLWGVLFFMQDRSESAPSSTFFSGKVWHVLQFLVLILLTLLNALVLFIGVLECLDRLSRQF